MFRLCISAFFICAIFNMNARADDVSDTYPFKFSRWQAFNEMLTRKAHQVCRNLSSHNAPADVFPHTQPVFELGDKCIAEVCGTDNRKYVKAMPDLFSGTSFSNKHKKLIDKAIKNSAENEQKWLAAHINELKKNRPFSSLTTDQQILSAIFYPDYSSEFDFLKPDERDQIDTRASANWKIKERFRETEEKYEKEFSTQSTEKLKEQAQNLSDKINKKFGNSKVMADLTPYMRITKEKFQINDAGGNSIYYRTKAISNLAYLSSLSEALEKKEDWKKDLVDLGSPNRDLKSLTLHYEANAASIKASVAKAIKDCANRAGERNSHLPTRAQIQKMSSSVEKTKQKIKDKYLSQLSEHSRKVLSALLDKTRINLPPSKEEHEKAMVKKFEILASSQAGSDIAGSASTYELQSTQSYQAYMWQTCQGIPTRDSDSAMVGDNVVDLSEWALSDNGAETIIAHELFHVLDPSLNSQDLSDESMRGINKTKTCLTDLHGGNNYYLSEDWADAGASLIADDTNEHFACEMIVNGGTGDPYYAGNGSHSPSLLRLLHQQIYKKEGLPPSCKKFVEKYIPQLTKKCF